MPTRISTSRTSLGACPTRVANTCPSPSYTTSRKCNTFGTNHINVTRNPCNSWNIFNSPSFFDPWSSYRPIYAPTPRIISPIIYTDSSMEVSRRETTTADVVATVIVLAGFALLIAMIPNCRDQLVFENGEWFRDRICTQWTPW